MVGFDMDLLQKILKYHLKIQDIINSGDTSNTVYLDQASRSVFYFWCVSAKYGNLYRLIDDRPVIGIVSVDNYDDLEDVSGI